VPRQIIDTESSRPAYVRRRIATFVVTAAVVLAIAATAWFLWGRYAVAGAH
jgi:hypothetical protein